MQSDWLNSVLSPVVYGDNALSINTQYKKKLKFFKNRVSTCLYTISIHQ